MAPRKWLAWKLVQLAHRLHDPEWVETLEINTKGGSQLRINVLGDEYGCGITSMNGIPWTAAKDLIGPLTCELEGWTFMWHDSVPYTLVNKEDY